MTIVFLVMGGFVKESKSLDRLCMCLFRYKETCLAQQGKVTVLYIYLCDKGLHDRETAMKS